MSKRGRRAEPVCPVCGFGLRYLTVHAIGLYWSALSGGQTRWPKRVAVRFRCLECWHWLTLWQASFRDITEVAA